MPLARCFRARVIGGYDERPRLRALDGGFNINVKGNTDLKGATIASDADASKNILSTGTLTYADVQNQSSYNAHSGGFGAGVTTGDGGSNYSTHGPTSGKNAGGGAPMLSQNDGGSDSATTRSGISAGTINVADSVHQTQDVASLNRDTTNTNGTVANGSTTAGIDRLCDYPIRCRGRRWIDH